MAGVPRKDAPPSRPVKRGSVLDAIDAPAARKGKAKDDLDLDQIP